MSKKGNVFFMLIALLLVLFLVMWAFKSFLPLSLFELAYGNVISYSTSNPTQYSYTVNLEEDDEQNCFVMAKVNTPQAPPDCPPEMSNADCNELKEEAEEEKADPRFEHLSFSMDDPGYGCLDAGFNNEETSCLGYELFYAQETSSFNDNKGCPVILYTYQCKHGTQLTLQISKGGWGKLPNPDMPAFVGSLKEKYGLNFKYSDDRGVYIFKNDLLKSDYVLNVDQSSFVVDGKDITCNFIDYKGDDLFCWDCKNGGCSMDASLVFTKDYDADASSECEGVEALPELDACKTDDHCGNGLVCVSGQCKPDDTFNQVIDDDAGVPGTSQEKVLSLWEKIKLWFEKLFEGLLK